MKIKLKRSMLQSVIKQVIKQGQDSKADYEYKKAKKRALNMGKKNFPPFQQWKEQNGMTEAFETTNEGQINQFPSKQNDQIQVQNDQDLQSAAQRVLGLGLKSGNGYSRQSVEQLLNFIQDHGGREALVEYLEQHQNA